MSDRADYKDLKEAFVTGHSGSSIKNVLAISSVALASVGLYSVIRTRLPLTKDLPFILQWAHLVVPLLLSMTTFAGSSLLLASVLNGISGIILLALPRRDNGHVLPSPASPTTASPRRSANRTTKAPRIPYLTTYRAHMMLMTILAILAVDFPVFPRSLAKCETFGVGLMDIGVGSFVFAQGISSALPFLKDPTHIRSPTLPKLVRAATRSAPVLALGFIRVILVKGTEYPEHVSEYGQHWNFFITLGALPLLEVLLHPSIKSYPISLIGLVVATAHQIGLSYFGLQEYVQEAPRIDLISANKEGIVSLLGYFSLHLLGLSLGTVLLPSSPSFFRKVQKQLRQSRYEEGLEQLYAQSRAQNRKNDKIATELCAYSILWWTCLGVSLWFKLDGTDGMSRRLVNLSFIFWIAAYNTSFILGYLILDLIFFPTPTGKRKSPDGKEVDNPAAQGTPAPLLAAINQNGLAIFLVANVGTGLINLTTQTMYTRDSTAMIILSVYSFVVTGVAWMCRGRRLLSL